MIFIALGSSIGDADMIFNQAETWLELNGVEVVQRSKNLKNPAIGGVAQNEFTNAVWQVDFLESNWEKCNWVLLPKSRRLRLKAKKLLQRLQTCEQAHGRIRTERWADRTLDLDILMFHQLITQNPALCIPHPEISNRDFVKNPWKELVDDQFEVPTLGVLKDL